CPGGFFSLGVNSYAICVNLQLTWDEAQTFCGSLAAGARLAELETQAENDLLRTHLSSNGYPCDAYWIGGEELSLYGTFTWASNGGPMLFYSDTWYNYDWNDYGAVDNEAIYIYCPYN
ncbi:unnamed protein product, partial [Cyprideis torosa]